MRFFFVRALSTLANVSLTSVRTEAKRIQRREHLTLPRDHALDGYIIERR